MPACLTHAIFAQGVKEALAGEIKVGENASAYAWGAQGPDFFFCHRYFPWMQGRPLQHFGSMLHKDSPTQALEALRAFLDKHEDETNLSYIQGFLCHYAADSTVHPYVKAFAQELKEERSTETEFTLHGEIEAAIDAIYLRYETGCLPSEKPLKALFPKNEGVLRRIAKLYREMLFAVYGEGVEEVHLVQAMEDTRFVFSCLTDRTGMKKRIFEALEKGKPHYVASHIVPLTELPDIDYANIQNQPWGMGEVKSEASVFQLLEQAKEVAITLMRNFRQGDFVALTGGKPFG